MWDVTLIDILCVFCSILKPFQYCKRNHMAVEHHNHGTISSKKTPANHGLATKHLFHGVHSPACSFAKNFNWFLTTSPERVSYSAGWSESGFKHPAITINYKMMQTTIEYMIRVCLLASKHINGHQKHGEHGFKMTFIDNTKETLLGGVVCFFGRDSWILGSEIPECRTTRAVPLIQIWTQSIHHPYFM